MPQPPVKTKKDAGLEDVQVLGEWNFTLQTDTPLYWIRSGSLDRYLLKFKAKSPCVPSTFGIVFHAEADGPGTDGVSFWVERRSGREKGTSSKRYVLAGEALESTAIVTKTYDGPPDSDVEEVEMLMQGYTGTIMLQNRKVQLSFRLKHHAGSIAFYNTTKNDKAPSNDVFFGGVCITALRRGPLEVDGIMARRERKMLGFHGKQAADEVVRSDQLANQGVEAEMAVAMGLDEFSGASRRTSMPAADGGTSSQQFSVSAPNSFHSDRTRGPGGGSRDPIRMGGGGKLPAMASTTSSGWTGSSHRSSKGLQRTASDSLLKKKQLKPTGLSRTMGGGEWLPLATNAPHREQSFMKKVSYQRDVQSKNACSDFIAI
eukprot:TRINITY_DN9959_c0_g1_i1.p1 TRINITY_DN9959_c0_g1~~TRINITY_DN9959_c0_g1_i1.p1  ORF type:complete len:373 (+),score=87.65 TRINITY_DN9959_c0_g1_i1:111-1229(+)